MVLRVPILKHFRVVWHADSEQETEPLRRHPQ